MYFDQIIALCLIVYITVAEYFTRVILSYSVWLNGLGV